MRPALVQSGNQNRRQEVCKEGHHFIDQKVIAASSYETVSMQKGELDEQVKELFFVSTRASNSAKEQSKLALGTRS